MTFTEKAAELAGLLQQPQTEQAQIEACVAAYYELLEAIDSEEDNGEVEQSMVLLSQAFGAENRDYGNLAAMICGSLIEGGYSATPILVPYILFYKGLLDKAVPFWVACQEQTQLLNEEDEEYHTKLEAIKEALRKEWPDAAQAADDLDSSYYLCGVSIFSSSPQAWEQGKAALSQVSVYQKYSIGCYWLTILFTVLFEEPLLVIDLNTRQGFKGRIHGIVDNFQLQLLLMSMPEINDTIILSEEQIAVIKGYGPQTTETSATGKWNMYNWEYMTHRPELENKPDYRESMYWIWSEGIPADISVFQGHRVVLLDTPAYQRGLPVQRTFNNLEADIVVDSLLSATEADEWLTRMRTYVSS